MSEGVPLHVDHEKTPRQILYRRDLNPLIERMGLVEQRVEDYRDETRESAAKFLTVQWDPLRVSLDRLIVAVAVAIGIGTLNSVLMAIALWRWHR